MTSIQGGRRVILNHLDCADYRFAPPPLVPLSMFRIMAPGCTQQAKSAETRVILIVPKEFLLQAADGFGRRAASRRC